MLAGVNFSFLMQGTIVNVNYRGRINTTLDFDNIKIGKVSKHPNQLLIKDPQCTLLFFRNGKFRIMGFKSDDDIEAMCVFSKYFKDFIPEELVLQSMTVKAKFQNGVNLHKLSELVPCVFELELFPTLTITKYKPVKVNVFSTGSIIICGIKDFSFSNTILNELYPLLCECTQETRVC